MTVILEPVENLGFAIQEFKPLSPSEVEDLHRAFLAGDLEAGYRLMSSLSPIFIDVPRRYRSRWVALMGRDEIYQELYMHCWRTLPTFNPAKAKLSTWAWNSAFFRLNSMKLKWGIVFLKRDAPAKQKLKPIPVHHWEELPIDMRQQRRVAEMLLSNRADVFDCLIRLPARHRRVIFWLFIEGVPLREIGRREGFSTQRAQQLLTHARHLILQGGEHEPGKPRRGGCRVDKKANPCGECRFRIQWHFYRKAAGEA